MLTFQQAEHELNMAVQMNPGPWEQHSYSVANNARLIAQKVPRMDSEKAFVMGLLHDIGRRVGVTGILHIFDGYDYLMGLGEPDLARICLTHSFPGKDVNSFFGKYDCSKEQVDFLKAYLENAVKTGLLPNGLSSSLQTVGNTCLSGAHLCLCVDEEQTKIEFVKENIYIVDLSLSVIFQEEFMDNIGF